MACGILDGLDMALKIYLLDGIDDGGEAGLGQLWTCRSQSIFCYVLGFSQW